MTGDSSEPTAQLSDARKRVLTVTLCVFLALCLGLAVWCVAILAEGGSSDRPGHFVAFMFLVIGLLICQFIYGWGLLARRQEMARERTSLWIALYVGGPLVAIPVYWWQHVGPGSRRSPPEVGKPEPARPSDWGPARCRIFALVAYLPPILFGFAMLLTLVFSDQGERSPTSAGVLGVAALILWAVGGVWTIHHLIRRPDIEEVARNRWITGVMVFGPIAIPLAWRNLIRGWARRRDMLSDAS